MPISRTTAVALLAAAAGAAALLALTSRPPATAPAAPSQPAALVAPAQRTAATDGASDQTARALRQELDAMRRELASLKTKQRALDRELAEVDAPAPRGDDDPGDEPGSTATAEQDAERFRAALADLARQAAQEPRDPEWSDWAQGEIVRGFETAAPAGAALVHVDCRRSLCELSLAFASEQARDEGVTALPEAIPWDGQAVVQGDPADPLVLMVYAGREGYDLPGFSGDEG